MVYFETGEKLNVYNLTNIKYEYIYPDKINMYYVEYRRLTLTVYFLIMPTVYRNVMLKKYAKCLNNEYFENRTKNFQALKQLKYQKLLEIYRVALRAYVIWLFSHFLLSYLY